MEAATRSQQNMSRAGVSFVQAAITFVVVVLAWLALDDITTDNSTGFLPEYRFLAGAGAWCLFVAYTLLRKGRRAIGGASVVAVAAAALVAFDGLGHKRDGGWSAFWPEYSVMLATWLWFLALSIILFALGRRARPTGGAGRA
jgi:hypothetical protein